MQQEANHKAVILLAHGSPKNYAKDVLLSIKEKIAKHLASRCVLKHAFLQFNQPLFKECLNELDSTIQDIVILPVFISHGSHTLKDIPSIVESYRKSKKNKLNVKVAEPLGADDLLVKALFDRYSQIVGKD